MQEIVIILSSLAGVATAAAVRRRPKEKIHKDLDASSQIKDQIRTLNIEKEILNKTISRLYQVDSEYSKIQCDKLSSKYQHQLGIVLARLEKLEQASKYPDLGPIGDGLITLMDQKLSNLDNKLYELSSKISTAETSRQEVKQEKNVPEVKQEKNVPEVKQEKNVPEVKTIRDTFGFDKPRQIQEPIIIPPKQRQSFELTTLTRLSTHKPNFPFFENQTKSNQEESEKIENKIETVRIITPKSEIKYEVKPNLDKEVAKITEHKALPEPHNKQKTILLDDDFDDDSDDLDKIKVEIMNVLSKLDQAEVE